jgi:hypothetical protein
VKSQRKGKLAPVTKINIVLMAKHKIDVDQPLLIVNCHQFLEWDADDFHDFCRKTEADGVIATFKNNHPRFSYVSTNDQGLVNGAADKKPISENATCGVYFWKRGADFIKYSEQMISCGTERAVVLAYSYALQDGLQFSTYKVDQFWHLKFPKDLENFSRQRI